MAKIIRNAHNVEGLNIISRDSNEVVNEFMSKFIQQLSVELERRIRFSGQASFLSNREQLIVISTQAAAKITDTFLIKPTFTGIKPPAYWEEFTGADCDVDLWIMYSGVTFLINISNTVLSLTSKQIKKSAICNWRESIDRFKEVEAQASTRRRHHGLIIGVGLQMSPLYKKVLENDDSLDDAHAIYKIRDKLYENLSPMPNWSARWITNMKDIFEHNGYKEKYPAIIYIGYITKISDDKKTDFSLRIDPAFNIRQSRRKVQVGGINTYYKFNRLIAVKPDVKVY